MSIENKYYGIVALEQPGQERTQLHSEPMPSRYLAMNWAMVTHVQIAPYVDADVTITCGAGYDGNEPWLPSPEEFRRIFDREFNRIHGTGKCILMVTDHGDPSVGCFPQTWEVLCPFATNTDRELKTEFANMIQEVYREYCDGRCEAWYKGEDYDDEAYEVIFDDNTGDL